MNRRRHVVIAVAAALALGGTYAALRAPHRAPSSSEEARAARAPRWTRGIASTFDFNWRAEETVRAEALAIAGASSIDGAVALRGQLVLRALGEKDGAMILAARIDPAVEHRLTILGKDAFASDAEARAIFEGREALVAIEPSGRVRAVHVPKDAPPLFAHVARGLLEQLGVTVPDGARGEWTATEPGPSGEARVRYEAKGKTIERRREAYDRLTAVPAALSAGARTQVIATGHVALDDDGALASMDDDEAVAVDDAGRTILASKNALALTRIATAPFEAPATVSVDEVAMTAFRPGDAHAAAEETEEARVSRLADEITIADVQKRLAVVAAGGAMPKGFLTRAAALVALHPEYADALEDDFEKAPNARGKEAILDVLASAGTARAQRAMRDALGSDAARVDPKVFDRLLQRFTFVERPDADTLAFLRSSYDAARARRDRDGELSAAYSLGAAAGKLARAGDDAGSKSAALAITRALDTSSDPAEKRGLLAAIGNAGTSDALRAGRAYATSDDPALRAGAADALRKVDSPEARATLTDLLGDDSPDVAHAALQALSQAPLDRDEVARVAAMATNATAPGASDRELVTFFAGHREPAAAVEAALQAIEARAASGPSRDNDTALRAQNLIDELQGKPKISMR